MVTDLTQLFTDLIRVETRLYNAVDARLRQEHGLPLGQYEFLRFISGRTTTRVYDIAQEMAITIGATSKAVDRLEAAGLCSRHANPDDRRSSLLAVTPAGRKLLAEATPTFEAELAHRVGSVLPAETIDRLAVTLSMLRQNLEIDKKLDPSPQPQAESDRR